MNDESRKAPAPPKPAPDAMREALEQIEAMQVGHAATIAREILKSIRSAAPVPPADGALESDIKLIGTALSKGDHPGGVTQAFYRVAAALRSPSPAVAAEPVSDERALELAHQICTGKLSAVQGAVEIMQYATDGVLQIQVATPPVRGDRETLIAAIRNVKMNNGKKIDTVLYIKNIELIADAILSLPVQLGAGERETPFQKRVIAWMMECFSMESCWDGTERNHRFLEESLELVQSLGCTASEAHQLVDYVFGRPSGDPVQELGGVMVTIAALCFPNDLDMNFAAETELARVWKNIEKIRAKQEAKPKHSPLPEASRQVPHSSREGGR